MLHCHGVLILFFYITDILPLYFSFKVKYSSYCVKYFVYLIQFVFILHIHSLSLHSILLLFLQKSHIIFIVNYIFFSLCSSALFITVCLLTLFVICSLIIRNLIHCSSCLCFPSYLVSFIVFLLLHLSPFPFHEQSSHLLRHSCPTAHVWRSQRTLYL